MVNDEVISTIPTIGFNVESIRVEGIELNVWDIGGRGNVRALERHYYPGSHGIVYVINVLETPERMMISSDEIQRLQAEENLSNLPILIFLNKTDLPGGMKVDEIKSILNISTQNMIHIQSCSAHSGEGVEEGFAWLSNAMSGKSRVPTSWCSFNCESMWGIKEAPNPKQALNYFLQRLQDHTDSK